MSRRPLSKRRRYTLVGLAVAAFAVAAALAWLGVRGMLAKADLDAALESASALTAAIDESDLAAAQTAADDFAAHAESAAALTGDPVWRAAEFVPFAGPNLAAVRIVSESAHSVVAGAVSPLLHTADRLAQGAPDGALVDVGALREAAPALSEARTVVEAAVADVGSIDGVSLLPQLRDAVEAVYTQLEDGADIVDAAADASEVVPAMLGADGPRSILVMLQNNAELRTGGGITGSFIELRAVDGRLSLIRQADSADFPVRKKPIVDLPASVVELYGDVAGRFVQNTSMTPDFALTSEMASAWWTDQFGVTPDAVVSVDPLVLRALLTVTGPVETASGPLEADNVVQRLLIDPYRLLTPEEQTAVFQDATTAVFDALTRGVDSVALIRGLASPISEGRVSVWSAHPEEQGILSVGTLAGALVRQNETANGFAVYLNDATGGKMGPYLDVDLAIGETVCREDGRPDSLVSVTLTSTAPATAATSLPLSVTGGGEWGTPAGDISTSVAVAAPTGWFVGAVAVDGEAVGAASATDSDHPVAATTVDLHPGDSATLTFRFTAGEAGDVTPELLHTPLLTNPTVSAIEPDCG